MVSNSNLVVIKYPYLCWYLWCSQSYFGKGWLGIIASLSYIRIPPCSCLYSGLNVWSVFSISPPPSPTLSNVSDSEEDAKEELSSEKLESTDLLRRFKRSSSNRLVTLFNRHLL